MGTNLLSCTNCCFNPLQYDMIGTSFGYCVEHKAVLRCPGMLTCGRLLRKDLTLPRAKQEQATHENRFTKTRVSFLQANGATPQQANYIDKNTSSLVHGFLTDLVIEYDAFDPKILSCLGQMVSARAEVAFLSLSRTYVDRCVSRDGNWVGGLELYWRTKNRLLEEPDIRVGDIYVEAPIPISRQLEMAKWAVLMLRLVFMADIGYHADDESTVAQLRILPQKAAEDTKEVDYSALHEWVRREGAHIAENALSATKIYESLLNNDL